MNSMTIIQIIIISSPTFIVISTGFARSSGMPFKISLKFMKWNGLYGKRLINVGKIIGKKNKIKWTNNVKYMFFNKTFKIMDSSITNNEITSI